MLRMDYASKVYSAEKYGNISHIYRNNGFSLAAPTQATFHFQAVHCQNIQFHCHEFAFLL